MEYVENIVSRIFGAGNRSNRKTSFREKRTSSLDVIPTPIILNDDFLRISSQFLEIDTLSSSVCTEFLEKKFS
jgi:hypothetical protein